MVHWAKHPGRRGHGAVGRRLLAGMVRSEPGGGQGRRSGQTAALAAGAAGHRAAAVSACRGLRGGGGVVGLGAGPGMSGPGAKLRWARKARTRCRILDGGDDAQPAATAGPGEDSEIERTVHQRRPGPGVGGDRGVGLAREGGSVWGGAAVADDLGAPARARGEDAVVEKQVHRGTGDEGRKLLEDSMGSKRKWEVPSRHTVWSSTRTRPSGRRRRRSCFQDPDDLLFHEPLSAHRGALPAGILSQILTFAVAQFSGSRST